MAAAAQEHQSGPDPTPRTVEALAREIGWVRSETSARFDAIGKAVELLQAYPTDVDRAVSHLRELHEEKFSGVAMQFQQRDVALAAALQSQKDAAAKSESAFTKQIDGILAAIAASAAAVSERIDDVKTRLTAIESNKAGSTEQRGQSNSLIGTLIGIAGVALAAIAFLVR